MKHSRFTALYDACVLYPAPLRDLLMWLGLSGLFRARWSSQIHGEWKRSLLANRLDLSAEQLDRTSQLMDEAIPDALVSGHETLIPNLVLPDPDDRHVLAAAVRCNADVIVTFNEKDFPADILQPLGIEAQHPDEFIDTVRPGSTDSRPGRPATAIIAEISRRGCGSVPGVPAPPRPGSNCSIPRHLSQHAVDGLAKPHFCEPPQDSRGGSLPHHVSGCGRCAGGGKGSCRTLDQYRIQYYNCVRLFLHPGREHEQHLDHCRTEAPWHGRH